MFEFASGDFTLRADDDSTFEVRGFQYVARRGEDRRRSRRGRRRTVDFVHRTPRSILRRRTTTIWRTRRRHRWDKG